MTVTVDLRPDEIRWVIHLIEDKVINNPVTQGYERRMMAHRIVTKLEDAK